MSYTLITNFKILFILSGLGPHFLRTFSQAPRTMLTLTSLSFKQTRRKTECMLYLPDF